MEESFVDNEEKFGPKIIPEKEWLNAEVFEGNHRVRRGVLCLEDLAKRELQGKKVILIEVGPVGTFDREEYKDFKHIPKHIAPISVFAKRHPDATCLAAGLDNIIGRETTIGSVPYLRVVMGIEKCVHEKILTALGGHPNIVYGQHVFESSRAGGSLPIGPYKIFEEAANLLEEGGFIVVDNDGGTLRNVGKLDHWPATARMQHVYSYQYKDIGSQKCEIIVYKKM